jgi:hypothetical protein
MAFFSATGSVVVTTTLEELLFPVAFGQAALILVKLPQSVKRISSSASAPSRRLPDATALQCDSESYSGSGCAVTPDATIAAE